MKILVTGGAGYIGSFMTRQLLDVGHEVVVFDNLEKGHKKAVDPRAKFQQGDLLNEGDIDYLFSTYEIEAVIHFAGLISVGESVKYPEMYFRGNTMATLNLLEKMVVSDVRKIIFSSTAAVYGTPQQVPIPESHPTIPDSPYGESKLMVEKMLKWFAKSHDISYVALRYFNAAGAALDGSLGEAHEPETHIIPNAISAALKGESFSLFGDDYNTQDGTCIRDYIHVEDLARAHLLSLEKIQKDPGGYIYNAGTGKGYSNRQVLEKVKEISAQDFQIDTKPRREGDSPELVADASKIKEELNFQPQHSDLDTIIKSAWKFHSSRKA